MTIASVTLYMIVYKLVLVMTIASVTV